MSANPRGRTQAPDQFAGKTSGASAPDELPAKNTDREAIIIPQVVYSGEGSLCKILFK